MNNSLSQHLTESINKQERVDESLVLGAIVATTCLTYAVAPVLNTDFMKSVGEGLGKLLGGFGSLFGNLSKKDSPDDKASKELHDLLKKKPSDLSPKEKSRLKELAAKFDLSDELSDNELKRFEEATNSSLNDYDAEEDKTTKKTDKKSKSDDNKTADDDTNDDKDNTPVFDNNTMSGLLMLAEKANKNNKDENEKKKNEALINLLAAASYDKDGNEIPMEDRLSKLKDMVGEDGWEAFKKDINDTYEKNKDSKEFKEALEDAKNSIKASDVESFVKSAKEKAKTTLNEIEKERKKIEDSENNIKELQKKIDAGKKEDDIEDLKKQLKDLKQERDELVKNSIVGQASPAVAETITNTTETKPEGEKEGEKETKPEGEKEPKDYTNEEIEKIQDELADLDEEKDKNKIKEKEELLKSIAKAKGKDESDYLPKNEKTKDGKVIQKKVGPMGGKYYRSKGEKGWSNWQNYQTPDQLPESKQYNSLSNYLIDKIIDK